MKITKKKFQEKINKHINQQKCSFEIITRIKKTRIDSKLVTLCNKINDKYIPMKCNDKFLYGTIIFIDGKLYGIEILSNRNDGRSFPYYICCDIQEIIIKIMQIKYYNINIINNIIEKHFKDTIFKLETI